jgi:hypothetical protein
VTDVPAAARATVFANGLRKNLAASGRRWNAWPRGAAHLAAVAAAIEAVERRLAAASDAATVDGCTADLRAILEWSVYQNAALAAARSLRAARRTRALTHRLHLLADDAGPVQRLADAEETLIAVVRERNVYLEALRERHAHLQLPPPLVVADALLEPIPQAPGRLALIQSLKQVAASDGARSRSPANGRRALRVGRVVKPR